MRGGATAAVVLSAPLSSFVSFKRSRLAWVMCCGSLEDGLGTSFVDQSIPFVCWFLCEEGRASVLRELDLGPEFCLKGCLDRLPCNLSHWMDLEALSAP